jgi:hypothetical protein
MDMVWAAGSQPGVPGNSNFYFWNNPIPTGDGQNAFWQTVPTSFGINAIAMISYGGGYAVGNSSSAYLFTPTNLTSTEWQSSYYLPQNSGSPIYEGISCISTVYCYAVGTAVGNNSTISYLNGTAGFNAVSNAATAHGNNLYSVSCVPTGTGYSAVDCWAVGDAGTGSTNPALFRLQGGNTVSSTSFPSGTYPYDGIFCNSLAAGDIANCLAVGYTGASATGNYAFYNGTTSTWSAIATGLSFYRLNSIACTSSTNCWAVGQSASTANLATSNVVIAHYTSTSATTPGTWSVPSPAVTQGGILNSVACSSATECWAVGVDQSGNSLEMYYNGTAWATYTDASSTGIMSNMTLNAVAVIGPNAHPVNGWTRSQ